MSVWHRSHPGMWWSDHGWWAERIEDEGWWISRDGGKNWKGPFATLREAKAHAQ